MSPRASRSRRGLRWTAFAALPVSAVLPVTVLLLTTDQDPCSTPGVPVPYPVAAAVCGWIGLACCVLCLVLGGW
ncbi:MAG TPA: hypothetical protein VHZ97_12740 [Pseudonocardiaceae bacterium]|jgi:hypothetical protein|nr:hypothetical protein [Pseudonocardiaceae bacterium]